MLTINNNTLVFDFTDIHPAAKLTINLHRTLRVPEEGTHALPTSLGHFPIQHVDDHKVPQSWIEHGGIMLPMWQSEAMWLSFGGDMDYKRGVKYPFAIKIAAGKVNAITGDDWTDGLNTDQDYCVAPKQPWIDGFCTESGKVKQFVAAHLGEGRTVEEQVTGKAEHGGIQIVVYPMKVEEYKKRFPLKSRNRHRVTTRGPGVYADSAFNLTTTNFGASMDTFSCAVADVTFSCSADSMDMSDNVAVASPFTGVELQSLDMGLGAGGEIEQEIFDDPFGIGVWDTTQRGRCFLHLCNSTQWQRITGSMPPTRPVTKAQYAARGYPWYKWYDDGPVNGGSDTLASVPGVSTPTVVTSSQNFVISLGPKAVAQGEW